MSDEHMNDKELEAVLREWTPQMPAGQPDRSRVVGTVVGRLGSTRRHRYRRWPFPWFRRDSTNRASEQSLAQQASPIPAFHGHTPTVMGRTTQSMLSPAKAITVAALVFALGGAMLIAQPFDRQASMPGGATEAIRPGLATSNGLIAFAADASAGEALTDQVDYGMVETHPEPMDIYVTGPGEPTRRLIATDAHERCPAFSPDGQYLAYVELGQRVRSVAPSIVVERVNVSGVLSAPELRVSLPADAVYERKLSIGPPCPQWSPDGSQIAYLTLPQRELRVSTLDGQERVLDSITPNFVDGPFAWSPDGDAIAYTTSDGVWKGSLDGSAPTLVRRTDGRPVSVSWSPGDELAVTVLTELALEGGGIRDVRTVHVIDVDTGSERSVGTIYEYDYGAVWSPDGSRLAFVDENGNVRSIDSSDGSMTTLSPRYADGREMHFWDAAWSPDGERLLALARSDSSPSSAASDSDIGFALVSLSTDGASADVLTPWTWALDWINLQEVSWQPITN